MVETRVDYEEVARSMARSIVVQVRISRDIERWIDHLHEIAGDLDDPVAAEEARMLSEAWRLELARRRIRDTCPDCDYSRRGGHDPCCPRYHDATETLERR